MFDKISAEKKKFIPKKGANLVGLDEFEPIGEKLYLIGSYPSKGEAEAKKKERLKKDSKEVLFVYTSDDA